MSMRQSQFLIEVLGAAGFDKLSKSLEIDQFLPNAALSWLKLQKADLNDWLPGNPDTEIKFKKFENVFTGQIFQKDTHTLVKFENESEVYVVSAICAVLGNQDGIFFSDKLGESTDLLVKAEVLTKSWFNKPIYMTEKQSRAKKYTKVKLPGNKPREQFDPAAGRAEANQLKVKSGAYSPAYTSSEFKDKGKKAVPFNAPQNSPKLPGMGAKPAYDPGGGGLKATGDSMPTAVGGAATKPDHSLPTKVGGAATHSGTKVGDTINLHGTTRPGGPVTKPGPVTDIPVRAPNDTINERGPTLPGMPAPKISAQPAAQVKPASSPAAQAAAPKPEPFDEARIQRIVKLAESKGHGQPKPASNKGVWQGPGKPASGGGASPGSKPASDTVNMKRPKLGKSVSLPGKRPRVNILKSDVVVKCHTCGVAHFTGPVYTACLCWKSLAKSVKVQDNGKVYTFSFSPSDWDYDSVRTLLETLLGKGGEDA